jgi:hypothetical protein
MKIRLSELKRIIREECNRSGGGGIHRAMNEALSPNWASLQDLVRNPAFGDENLDEEDRELRARDALTAMGMSSGPEADVLVKLLAQAGLQAYWAASGRSPGEPDDHEDEAQRLLAQAQAEFDRLTGP